MNRRILAAGSLVLAMFAGLFVWAQQQSAGTQPLARLFPGGSLLYLEARDFAGLLADWNASAEKKLWLGSDNYQVFSRSRLFLKLSDAHQEFADAAGFLADLPMVQSVAGGQSALAIYDIGALEFLYITRMEASAAVNSVLLQRRSSYETRTAAGKSYYVRRGAAGRTAAFASTDGLLVLGTREDLVANAMKLLAGQNESALPAEAWYTSAVNRPQAHGDIRMVLNMTRLLESTYFRSYWIQRNASVLRPYTAGVVDLYREAGQLREERTLIRDGGEATASTAIGQVAAWMPDDAGLVRAWADPSPDSVADLIATKILSPGPTTRAELREAPSSLSPDTVLGTPADLETRIDQQPLETEKKNTEVETLTGVMTRTGMRAALQVQRSRTAVDGVYIGNETAVAVLGNADWPEVTLAGAHVHRSGRALVIASTPEILKSVADRLGNAPVAADASYIARYNHARELQPFTRMMEYLDAAKPRWDSGEVAPPPQFFSKNVASFGRTVGRLRSLEVTVRETAGESKQQIVYRLQ